MLWHRSDYPVDEQGTLVKITWPGVGLMPPEVEQARLEGRTPVEHKQGEKTWNGP